MRIPWVLASLILLASPARADTEIRIESLSADGLEVRRLMCNLSDGGLLGAAVVVGSLAQQRASLTSCAPEGAAFGVEFLWGGGKVRRTEITSSSQPKKNACVKAALQRVRPAVAGRCFVILLAGKPEAARRAAEAIDAGARGGGEPAGKD